MTSNDNLTIVGKTPTVTNITLQPGWNMVGYPCSTSNIASDILPPEVSKIGVFSASAEYNVAYIYEDMFEFISIQTGRGYWMYNDADEAVIWIVDY